VKWKKAGGNYWSIDDICFIERITRPILTATPAAVDFGGVQLGETGTQTVTITNTGVSVLKIKKVELLAGPQFGLVDENNYPVEVTDGLYAYSINGTDALSFDVTFSPDDIGLYTGKVLVTYGLFEDMVAEINLVGEGLSCFTAAEAYVGENWAASQNSWFTYTAEKFQIVTINSCHPNQDVSASQEYAYDTWLWVFASCEGDLTICRQPERYCTK